MESERLGVPKAEVSCVCREPSRRLQGTGQSGPAVLFVLLLGFFLETFRLGAQELSYDEVASIYIISRAPQAMLSFLLDATFEHPPLYYLLLQRWVGLFGRGEFAVRFFSMTAAVLCLPLAFRLLRRLLGSQAGFLAMALLAISPFQIYYAQDARMYALACLLALVSLNAFEALLSRGGWQAWIVYGLSTIGLMSTHYYGVLIVLCQDVYLLSFWRHHRWVARNLLLAQGLLVMAFGGWALSASGFRETLWTLAGYGVRFPREVFASFRLVLSEFTVGRRVGPDLAWRLSLGVLPLALLGAWALKAPARGESAQDGRVVHGRALFLLYLLVPLVVALEIPYPFAARLLLPILPGYMGLLGVGIAWALHRPGALAKGISAAYFALLLGVFGYGLGFYYGRYVKQDYRAAVEEISRGSGPEDAIILTGPWQELLFNHYYRGDLPHFNIPTDVPPPVEPAEAEPVLKAVLSSFDRIWLVLSAEDKADPGAYVERWLEGNARRIYAKDQGDARLKLFEVPQGGPGFVEEVGSDFGGRLRLTGLRVDSWIAEVGSVLRLDLSWECLAVMPEDYKASVRLVDGRGLVWLQRDFALQAGERFTSGWEIGEHAQSHVALRVPQGVPPGRYDLVILAYPPSSLRALPVEGAHRSGGDGLVLGGVDIRGRSIQRWEGTGGLGMGEVRFGDEVVLLECKASPTELWQGESMSLLLRWQALEDIGRELSLGVELVDREGRVALGWSRPLAVGWYGTSQWLQGEVVIGQHVLQLPPQVPAGAYQVRLQVRDVGTGEVLNVDGRKERFVLGRLWRSYQGFAGDGFALAQVKVREQDRRWEAPSIPRSSFHSLGEDIEFLGYDFASSRLKPGETATIVLHWRARGTPAASYRVFIHMAREDESILAQTDQIPLGGARPTTSWLAGEFLVDEYRLPVGAEAAGGNCRLYVGMYDPATGVRLKVRDAGGRPVAGDRITLEDTLEVAGTEAES